MNDQTTGGELAVQAPRKAPAKPVLQADGHKVMAIMPRSIEEAQRYASGLIQADIVPDAFRVGGKRDAAVNAPLVLMGVLKSMEIGFPPQTGLAYLLPLNGRFTVWGDGAWALLQRGGQLKSHKVEWGLIDALDGPVRPHTFDKVTTPLEKWPTNYGVRVTMWRRGQDDPYIGNYTVGHAQRAKLWNNAYKKPWITDPERMLFNRSRAFAMRDGFADSLFGLGIAEEVQDYAAPPKPKQIDNSALDDDMPAAPAITDQSGDLTAQAAAYRAGLEQVGDLETLAEYQTQPAHVALFAALQRTDEHAYNALIGDNARRFQAIEQGDRERERREEEAREQQNRDAEEQGADGAAEAAPAAEPAKGDLFGGDEANG